MLIVTRVLPRIIIGSENVSMVSLPMIARRIDRSWPRTIGPIDVGYAETSISSEGRASRGKRDMHVFDEEYFTVRAVKCL